LAVQYRNFYLISSYKTPKSSLQMIMHVYWYLEPCPCLISFYYTFLQISVAIVNFCNNIIIKI
jgi:hypothetical protein